MTRTAGAWAGVSLVLAALAACAGPAPTTSRAPVLLPAPSSIPVPRPAAGDPCPVPNKYVCADTTSALLCRDGRRVPMPCRGPNGCFGEGDASKCDDDLGVAGDVCFMTLNENYACTPDHGSEVKCKDGTFAVVRTCKGPKKCVVEGDVVHCDDSFGDVGDSCIAEPNDANYSCSTDKKIEVVCDASTSSFQPSNSCRGSKGCYITDDRVHCDQSSAREGDICRPVDNHSCSEDATVELKCSPQGTWKLQRPCKHAGCRIKNNEVYCD
jgi:hypothetical protein